MIPLLLYVMTFAPITMEIYPQKKEAFLGEPIEIEFVFPKLKNRKIKGIVLDSPHIHIFQEKIKKDRVLFTIGIYKLGEIDIPVKLFLIENNKQREIKMPGFTLTVKESISGKGKIKPIKDVVGLFNSLWLFLLIFPALLIAHLIMRKKESIKEFKKEITPLEWVQKRLRDIKNEDLPQKGKYKEYYDAISDCLRAYLEKKYSILAMESTLGELQNILKDKFSLNLFRKIKMILEECDWIKFTPHGEKPRNIEGIWERAFNMVTNEL